jgi:hypothetical protein
MSLDLCYKTVLVKKNVLLKLSKPTVSKKKKKED